MRSKNSETMRSRMPDGALVTQAITYLMIFFLLALFAHMTERDNHPFNEENVQVKS